MGGCLIVVALIIVAVLVGTDNVFMGILSFALSVGLLWLYFRKISRLRKPKKRKQYDFLASEEEGFERMLMMLVAEVIRVDKVDTSSEVLYIQEALSKHFSAGKVANLMNWLKENLDESHDYVMVCRALAGRFELSSRMQLLHLLVGIVTADGLLKKKEYEMVKEMARHMRVPYMILSHVMAMFQYEKEWERWKKRSYSRPKARSKTSLNQAYAILGIGSSVSDKAVKKAYRKLAVLHHPDKVIHLGKEHQKVAKEKFQKIQEAYEIIKKSRNMA